MEMRPSAHIKTVDDARIHFGGHSFLGPLIEAHDSAPNGLAKDIALQKLIDALKTMTTADVSELEAQAKAA